MGQLYRKIGWPILYFGTHECNLITDLREIKQKFIVSSKTG